jgi:hypothetical protein
VARNNDHWRFQRRDAKGRWTKSATVKLTNAEQERARQVVANHQSRPFFNPEAARGFLAGMDAARGNPAVDRYRAGKWADINRALREGRTPRDVAEIDAAMAPLPEDIIVSRRIPREVFGRDDLNVEALVGRKLRDAAYTSAQFGDTRWAGPGEVKVDIVVPKGTPALVDPATGEVTLPRNTEIAIGAAHESNGGGWSLRGVLISTGDLKPRQQRARGTARVQPAATPAGRAPAETDTTPARPAPPPAAPAAGRAPVRPPAVETPEGRAPAEAPTPRPQAPAAAPRPLDPDVSKLTAAEAQAWRTQMLREETGTGYFTDQPPHVLARVRARAEAANDRMAVEQVDYMLANPPDDDGPIGTIADNDLDALTGRMAQQRAAETQRMEQDLQRQQRQAEDLANMREQLRQARNRITDPTPHTDRVMNALEQQAERGLVSPEDLEGQLRGMGLGPVTPAPDEVTLMGELRQLDSMNTPGEIAEFEADIKAFFKDNEFTDSKTGLSAEIAEVYVVKEDSDGNPVDPALKVAFEIRDHQGGHVGTATRVWRPANGLSPATVEHEFFKIEAEHRGGGFAKRWNAYMEDLYRSQGVERITLHANIDVGGYAWAKQGYGWDLEQGERSYTLVMARMQRLLDGQLPVRLGSKKPDADRRMLARLRSRLESTDPAVAGMFDEAQRAQMRSEIARLERGLRLSVAGEQYTPAQLQQIRDLMQAMKGDPEDPTFPTPLEVAMLGWTEGAEMWPGKHIMAGSNWYGAKQL